VPYDKFWKVTDNTCPKEGDPLKLRTQFAEKVVKQAELGAEEQLTYLARSAYVEVDKDEREVIAGAQRLERMTEDWLRDEAKALAKIEKGIEKEIEREETALESPLRQFLKNSTPFSSFFGRR